jgi:gluconate 2-dehydrogenase gamma chain
MQRREFIRIPAQALGGLLLYSLAGEPMRLQAQDDAGDTVELELRHFTATQARIIQAACERIMPSDESGPGATEAGVVIYIDRQLAGPYGRDAWRYTKGPWITDGWEGHGYQGQENPRQIYEAGLDSLGADFADLTAEEQDKRLLSIEDSMFFGMLRSHTVEGMFCDPLHGGNADLIGWQMLGFPGPVMSYKDRIEQHDEPYRPKPQSLEQIVGHPVKGMEDEDA